MSESGREEIGWTYSCSLYHTVVRAPACCNAQSRAASCSVIVKAEYIFLGSEAATARFRVFIGRARVWQLKLRLSHTRLAQRLQRLTTPSRGLQKECSFCLVPARSPQTLPRRKTPRRCNRTSLPCRTRTCPVPNQAGIRPIGLADWCKSDSRSGETRCRLMHSRKLPL